MKKFLYWLRCTPDGLTWQLIVGSIVTIIVLSSLFNTCNAQSFVQTGSYPYVVTSVKYDSSGNEYVARQQGFFYKNGVILRVLPVMVRDECGLIDFDFIPNGFVFHMSGKDSTQQIVLYDTIAGTLDTLLSVPYKNPFTDNHRGGSVIYIDSIIYCSFGYGAVGAHAQNLDDYRGKLLKIDLATMSIDIVLFGLRNPYRFDFDPEHNEGYLTDVGSNIAEEVNYFTGNYSLLNLGWPCYEGDSLLVDTEDLDSLCGGYAFSFPEYSYSQTLPRSIIGGTFWNGKYYFTDHFTGVGGSIYVDTAFHFEQFPITFPVYVTSMTTNLQNELVLSTFGGKIYKYMEPPLSIDDDEDPIADTELKGIYIGRQRIAWERDLVGQLVIYSVDGRVAFTTDLTNQEYFEYTDLPPGFYVITVYTNRGLEYSKAFVNIQ